MLMTLDVCAVSQPSPPLAGERGAARPGEGGDDSNAARGVLFRDPSPRERAGRGGRKGTSALDEGTQGAEGRVIQQRK